MAALEEYRSKRDLKRSPEPRARKVNRSRARPHSDAGTFTVQKHDAKTLHYDFRLELDGVLLSWAVPKGPSLDPSDKRLAIQTEDHPLEYGAFEGVIPEGHYGAGTVLVWDHGTWAPDGDARAAYRKGHLNFALDGQKLRGRWHLVRRGGTKNWLLFKSRDEFAKQHSAAALVDEAPDSVLSGQSLTEVAETVHARPSSTASAKGKARGRGRDKRRVGAGAPPGAHRKKLPEAVSRELATLVTELPEGQDKPAEAVQLEPPANPAPRKAAVRSPSVTELPVELTHPDRMLYASQGLTKRALAEYFVKVADWMLPYVQGRILTLVRCPRGQGGECFFQKHPGKSVPGALRTVEIQEQDKLADYLVLDDVAGLVSLVQIGALEVHVWGARADRPERPDQLVFDLDPGPGVAWDAVITATLAVRNQLSELGLESFVKTSGGKGLHVVVPVERRTDWDLTKTFCHAVAERICRSDPQKFVCTMSKAKREGRIFIDYLRNSRGATSVCAYSPRAREGATVSTPLGWSELTEQLRPSEHNVRTIPDRLASLSSDPWARYTEVHQSITKQMLRWLGAV